jgi:L-threonylcarbamoyladenylate synthase
MRILPIDPAHPNATALDEAAALLRAGRLVAFPTETVYGLGANALDAAAVDRIYRAKGRPTYNPLIVHVADAALVHDVAAEWPRDAEALAARFWPGPLTIVVPKRSNVPDGVTAGLGTVALRVPSHPIAHALLVAAQLPVAAPSANKSTQVSPTTAAHVAKSLGDAVDLILDGGPTSVGIESTVVDLSGSTPVLLRPGLISVPQLEAVVGPVAIAGPSSGTTGRPSPGMLDKHYAPQARVRLVTAPGVSDAIREAHDEGRRVGAIVIDGDATEADVRAVLPGDAAGYAARLYGTLYSLDDAGCDIIVIEQVPDAPEWLGVADRLRRAAY